MIEIGQVCVKTAGRDAGKKCVVIDILDHTYVLVDGQTRRKKVNMLHLEPTAKRVDLSKNASHQEVLESFKKMGWEIMQSKPKKPASRPQRVRAKKEPVKEVTKAIKKKLDEKIQRAQQPKDAGKKQAVIQKGQAPEEPY